MHILTSGSIVSEERKHMTRFKKTHRQLSHGITLTVIAKISQMEQVSESEREWMSQMEEALENSQSRSMEMLASAMISNREGLMRR